MLPIGGNSLLVFEKRVLGEPNSIGEREYVWDTVESLDGFLDYQAGSFAPGDSKAKLADTTHVFVGDYKALNGVSEVASRARVGDRIFNILMIDNPMELNYHWEVYLEYLGVNDER